MIHEMLDKEDYEKQQQFFSHHTHYQQILKDSEKKTPIINPNKLQQNKDSKQEVLFKSKIAEEESIKLGDNFLYDFDIYIVGNNTLLAYIVDNKYILYDMDNSTKKLIMLKNCELIVKSEKPESQESLYRIKFFEVRYNDNEPELVLLMAGKNGVIYQVNIEKDFETDYLLGHYTEIYDILIPRSNALFENLFFSCSKDRSIYLWNAAKKLKIAHFRDEFQLHTDAVALAMHHCNLILASSYYNGEILIWDINNEIIDKIKEAKVGEKKNKEFDSLEVRKAALSTKDIHSVTCDSIKFMGDLIASRDTLGNVKISLITKIGVVILKQFNYDQFENIWFLQLGYNPLSSILYLGNDNGEVFIWKKNGGNVRLMAKYELDHKFLIRKIMIQHETGMLFAISDDGCAWLHSIKFKELLKFE